MSSAFDPVKLLEILRRRKVRYVVIGGFAATAYGSHLPTTDVDITPERSRVNLERLSKALTDLDARVRTDGAPHGLAFSHDGRSLADVRVLNLTTRHGDLDLVMDPAGGTDFERLESRVLLVQVHGVAIPLASLDDVIASKRAANRPKDRASLPTLEAIRQRLRSERQQPGGPRAGR